MNAIFLCAVENTHRCELEVDYSKGTVDVYARHETLGEVVVALDKKRVVGLIQVLTECLGQEFWLDQTK